MARIDELRSLRDRGHIARSAGFAKWRLALDWPGEMPDLA
jgi:hypothetical protein